MLKMKFYVPAMAALMVLSGCATTAQYPISTECRSEKRLIDSSKDANDWILMKVYPNKAQMADAHVPNLREHIGNQYEIDCQGIYKVNLIHDFNLVNDSVKRRFFNYHLDETKAAMREGKDLRTEAEYQRLENFIRKQSNAITSTVSVARYKCTFPYASADGLTTFYRNQRLLFVEKRSNSQDYTPDGFRYDGGDLRGSAVNVLSALSGTVKEVCARVK